MQAHILTVVAYFVATFGVQATNHFAVNAGHYAKEPIVAPEPMLWGGLLAIAIQGAILTFLYARLRPRLGGIRGALVFALLMGGFLSSYIALAEPSKYLIAAKLEWFAVEACASALQFALFGLALGLIHEKFGTDPAAEPVRAA